MVFDFNGAHRLLQGVPDLAIDLANLSPVRVGWHLKAVVLREQRKVLIPARLAQRSERLLIEDIAQPLEEQQRKDELLVVARVNRPSQKHGGSPKVGFELLLGDAGHVSKPSLFSSATSRPSAANAASALLLSRCVASCTVSTSVWTFGST